MAKLLQSQLRRYKRQGKNESWLRGYARGWYSVEIRYQKGEAAANMRKRLTELVEKSLAEV